MSIEILINDHCHVNDDIDSSKRVEAQRVELSEPFESDAVFECTDESLTGTSVGGEKRRMLYDCAPRWHRVRERAGAADKWICCVRNDKAIDDSWLLSAIGVIGASFSRWLCESVALVGDGQCIVTLKCNDRWHSISIDNRVPCSDDGSVAFGGPGWRVALIEKAVARLIGDGYAALDGGEDGGVGPLPHSRWHAQSGFEMIAGSRGVEARLSDFDGDATRLCDYLRRKLALGNAVACATRVANAGHLDRNGLHLNRCYALVDVDDGAATTMMLVCNPWTDGHYDGDQRGRQAPARHFWMTRADFAVHFNFFLAVPIVRAPSPWRSCVTVANELAGDGRQWRANPHTQLALPTRSRVAVLIDQSVAAGALAPIDLIVLRSAPLNAAFRHVAPVQRLVARWPSSSRAHREAAARRLVELDLDAGTYHLVPIVVAVVAGASSSSAASSSSSSSAITEYRMSVLTQCANAALRETVAWEATVVDGSVDMRPAEFKLCCRFAPTQLVAVLAADSIAGTAQLELQLAEAADADAGSELATIVARSEPGSGDIVMAFNVTRAPATLWLSVVNAGGTGQPQNFELRVYGECAHQLDAAASPSSGGAVRERIEVCASQTKAMRSVATQRAGQLRAQLLVVQRRLLQTDDVNEALRCVRPIAELKATIQQLDALIGSPAKPPAQPAAPGMSKFDALRQSGAVAINGVEISIACAEQHLAIAPDDQVATIHQLLDAIHQRLLQL
jgi:Calpain family cysteine protease